MENGEPVRVLSKSQLEGVHSLLKKLLNRIVSGSFDVRVLDMFINKVYDMCDLQLKSPSNAG